MKLTIEEIRSLHLRHVSGESAADIARSKGLPHSTICRAFHRLGLPLRNPKKACELIRKLDEPEVRRLHRVYMSGVPIEDLPKVCIVAVSDDAIRKAFHRLKLHVRNKKDAVKIGWSRQTAEERQAVRETHKKIFKHGHSRAGSRSTEYRIWCGILTRCTNPKNHAWKDYGGRGITVCKRWMQFENFLADMGRRPKGKSIERKNNDGPYDPSNCCWATREEQARNTRRTVIR